MRFRFEFIECGEPEYELLQRSVGDFCEREMVEYVLKGNPEAFRSEGSMILKEGDNLICWFGCNVTGMGILQPYMLVTRRYREVFREYEVAKFIWKATRDWIEFLKGFSRRLEAVTNKEIEENGRLLRHLGFKKEGECMSYGVNGETYEMWGLVTELR
jgi:hypothetical protein